MGASIRRNTLWVFTGNLGKRLIHFAAGVVLARLLVPADFGLLVTVQVFTGLAGFVAGAGMGEALIRAKEASEETIRTVFTLQLLIGLGIYAAFFAIAPAFSSAFADPRYEALLRVSALSFLIRPFRNVPTVLLRRAMRFGPLAAVDAAQLVVASAVSIGLAVSGLGVWALVLGGLAGPVFGALALAVIAPWRPVPLMHLSGVRETAAYGLKTSANDLVLYFSQQTPNLIISRLEGPAMVGLFNKADSLGRMPFEIVAASAYPTVFRGLATLQDDLPKSWYVFLRTVTLSSLYTMPLYVGLFWLAEPFVRFVYGERWVEAAAPLEVLAVAALLSPLANAAGAVAAAQNRLGAELWIEVQMWLLGALGCLVGLRWGLVGVAWGLAVALVYQALRLAHLALVTLQGRWAGLLAALRAPILLNGLLALLLGAGDQMLPDEWRGQRPEVYLGMLGMGAAIAYGLAVLYAPLSELATEARRWRTLIGLSHD